MTGAGESVVLLRARGLSAERGGREVLSGIDLELTAGETVVVMGPNGAGKSTLLESLAGALPVSTGALHSEGRVALALQAGDLARRTALSNVLLALSWWGVEPAERTPRARAALDSLGAGHLADRAVRSLSGGERRRVHLARALAVRPDVLLLDEPFAGLDPPGRAALLEDAGAAVRAFARACIVVVHDRAEAWALADRLIVLIGGRIVASGRPAELLIAPPSPAVARFLGFDGQLADRDELLLTRPEHVRIADDGLQQARVTRVIPLEDRVRLELTLAAGRVYAHAPLPGPGRGTSVSVHLSGGVRFPRVDGAQGTVAAEAQPVIPF